MTRFASLFVLALSLSLVAACESSGNSESPVDIVGTPDVVSPDAGDVGEELDVAVVAEVTDEEVQEDAGGADTGEPESTPPVEWVDPFIGTGSGGFNVANTYPGPGLPFGMMNVSPDTASWAGRTRELHCGGYQYGDQFIVGFTHMHLHGTGVGDYGFVVVMPQDSVPTEPPIQSDYRAPRDLETETASPGYYAADLPDLGVRAELTATARTALHRYTWEEGREAVVLIDLAEMNTEGMVTVGDVDIVPEERRVRGMIHCDGSFSRRHGGYDVWFDIVFDREFASYGLWDDAGLQAGESHGEAAPADQISLGLWLTFDNTNERSVQAQVGISFVDAEGAAANLAAEDQGFDFDGAVTAAREAWAEFLGAIEIRGTTDDERTIFYTALYHSAMMPNLFGDVDGRYRSIDDEGSIRQADGWNYYTDLSMWDTFRTLHPLTTMLWPTLARDFARSLVRMAEEGGTMPAWPQGGGYTGSMIGSPADCVLAGTYLKGVTDFDAETALAESLKVALGENTHHGRDRAVEYNEHHYMPYDIDSGSVSKTLEYAFEDFCIANLAEALGEDETAATFRERALWYRNLWDAETQFFRPKDSSGAWLDPFNPLEYSNHYTEATAWQYSWFVPHDVVGLVDLFGSAEAMVAKLDEFFQRTKDTFQFVLPGSYYYHGNEPSMQAAYMFGEAGRPDKAAEWARWVMATNYGTDVGGIIGNDDGGTLAAWYVFSALGFYPLPGDTRYFVGSPLVSRATLHLPGGDLEITTENNSAENLYVQSLTLNGEALDEPWFDHSDIAAGGTLHFVMGPEPGDWGRGQ